MKRALAVAVGVALVASSLSQLPAADRVSRRVPSRAKLQKRLDRLEAQVRAQKDALDQLVRSQGPFFSATIDPASPNSPIVYSYPDPAGSNFLVSAFPQPIAPETSPDPDNLLVFTPPPTSAGFPMGPVDACLIHMNGSAIDPHFVVMSRNVDPHMIVPPRVKGLPFGSFSRAR